MKVYKNLGGDSGVVAYEIGVDWIKVQFRDNGVYTYTYQIPGKADVEQMKKLALEGIGLNSYISRVVKKRYASKS